MGGLQRTWYRFIRWFVKVFVFKATGGLRVIGAQNVPKSGALIIAPNHASYLDPPIIGCAFPRIVSFMAKEELFSNRLFGALIRSLGAFPVKRGSSDMESIRIALSILEGKNALLMFPEGTRNFGEVMHPLNRGAEMLAKRSGALVLPVGISGSQLKWGKGKKPKWGHITVNIGQPISYAEFEGKEKGAFVSELETRIASLCREVGYDLKIAAETKSATSDPTAGATTESSPQAPV